MKAAIEQRARQLGFDLCRFTTADAPATAAQFQHWLAQQRHGEMAYLQGNAHKRVDPNQVLPGAKSIIVLAASYAQVPPQPPANPQSSICNPQSAGLVARYARFTDYHQVLAERLRPLTDLVNQLGRPDTRSLWYVDTGPLLERDLAQRAGLGFIGKHTNLISRQLGNWFFLAEIITTLKLEPDPSEKNRCGTCTRCLSACPTQAITAPFQLDARRCISYLTIELKGSIPIEFRRAIGPRIFGCDDCLAVCPWNKFAREGRLMQQHARSDLAQPGLVELLALDDAGFKRRFAHTPMLRAKRRGLLRNVCVALGNTGDTSALPALTGAATGPEPLIAEHARWAIDQIESRKA
ncbi:MAG TPA: tRNA epoxyqueuosine(34) reductase QueG [Verrucomicrobiae bacterium]